MLKYSGLPALLEGFVEKDLVEWIFTDLKKPSWNIMEATYYVFPEEEMDLLDVQDIYLNADGDELPKEYAGLDLVAWLEGADIESVLAYLYEQDEQADIQLKAKSLQFFYDNDAFMEL